MRIVLAAFAAGVLFGTGLAMSGMTDPEKVLGFLDVSGAFDPTLAFVLFGAVVTAGVLFNRILRTPSPLLAPAFQLSSQQKVDRRLLAGASVFGVGWGLAGYCPGPALATLGVAATEALWFVPAMLVGMVAHRFIFERRDAPL